MANREPPFSAEVQLKASGQAALMLLEALIIDLIESGVLSADRAIDSIQTVVETKQQLVTDKTEDEVGRCAIGKLLIIENSLRSISYLDRHGPSAPLDDPADLSAK